MLVKKVDNKIQKLELDEFKIEKELQIFIEENIEELLNLEIVKSEFIKNYRIDTLAYDKENKSFVIIEYKRGSSYSVIDQGYSYLSTILNNKAELILEYNERKGKTLRRNEVDWSQTKIIFISQSFTKYQKDSLNFKDLPIEMYEVKKYLGDIILFNAINKKEASESIENISKKNMSITKVSQELRVYTLEDHLKNSSEDIVDIFNTYKEKIEEMIPEIEVIPKKIYIAFKLNNKNVVDFKLQKSSIKIWINAKEGNLYDSKKITRNVANENHNGNGDYELTIKNLDEMEYILSLIKDASKLLIK